MNAIYPPEPCLSPPDSVETYDERAEAELHYMQHDTPIAEYASNLMEAIGDDTLERLALLMRRRDATAVRDEIARIFDAYWSRTIRRRLEEERRQYERDAA